MFTYFSLAVAAGLGVGLYAWYKKQYGPNTYMPPEPQVKRTDLAFGYYLSTDETIEQIANHSSFIFEHNWDSPADVIRRMRKHDLPVVLTCTKECFGSFNSATLNPNIETALSDLFDALRDAGCLERVAVLYPIDEPDGRHVDHKTMAECVTIVRQVASRYAELANVKLGVIYSTHMTYPGIEFFDIIGIDKYGMGSNVLISKEFKELNRRRKPGQQIVLVPGGANPWKQDPTAFERYAHSHPEVVGIIAFLWIDYFENGQNNLGIANNGMAETYISLGKRLTGK